MRSFGLHSVGCEPLIGVTEGPESSEGNMLMYWGIRESSIHVLGYKGLMFKVMVQ